MSRSKDMALTELITAVSIYENDLKRKAPTKELAKDIAEEYEVNYMDLLWTYYDYKAGLVEIKTVSHRV